ncbi:hypothetical protein BH24CHL4_BH24CHL4_24310 [soil metagenome]
MVTIPAGEGAGSVSRCGRIECAFMSAPSVVEDRQRLPGLVDYMKLPLNTGQRSVVELERLDQHVLVAAPPGSGKTLTITRRIAHLLIHQLATPDQILALTFTERAANELATRLSAMTLPGVTAGTFHGRCFALLKEQATTIGGGSPLTLWTEQQQIDAMREAARDAGLKQLREMDVRRLKSALSRWKCSQLQIEDVVAESRFNARLTQYIFDHYRENLDNKGAVDFDDLIIRAADLLWNDQEIAQRIHNRYRFVFIDEFQDVSPEQYRFMSALAPPRMPDRQVVVVADDNQAIFGFRGANPKVMLALYRKDYRPFNVPLRENHRSVDSIVGAAKSLMRAGGGPETSESVRPGGFAIDSRSLATDRDEARWIAGQITRACANGCQLSQIAVLYRRHNRANLIEGALLDNGLGVRRIQPGRFYDQADVQEIIRYFELVASTQERTFMIAVNWPRFLVDEMTMNDLRRLARDSGLGVGELAERPDLLRAKATPLTATVVERFMSEVVSQVRQTGSRSAGEVVAQMLDLLECRRDPIPGARREDMRATLDELGKGLEAAAGLLERAFHDGQRVALRHGHDLDSNLAASLMRRVLTDYLNIPVTDAAPDDLECCTVALGNPANAAGANISLVADPDGEKGFTVTARAHRLCQMVLMQQERLTKGRFVVFDLETTSNRAGSAEILDIAAVVVEHGEITGQNFRSLMRPSSPQAITQDSINVHGLRWEQVAHAPRPAEVLGPFLEFIGDATLVGHNIQRFDVPVLSRACQEAGLPPPENLMLDTLLLAQRLRPGMPNALDDLLTADERRARGKHGAATDAQLTARVFLRLQELLFKDRELDVLTEELPVVAASIHATGAEDTADNALLIDAGARAFRFGSGHQPRSAVASWLEREEYTEAVRWLKHADPRQEADDQAWDRLSVGWMEVVRTFETTSRDQTLEGLIEFVALATPSDLDSGDAERVSMMTVYSAKGHEWPLVFLIGLEDDQYPYSSTAKADEVEEGRRSLYVGMTRAEERLILTWAGEVDGKRREPSRFLDDIRGHLGTNDA